MLFFFQAVLAVVLLVVSLLMFMVIRQVGVLLRRIPDADDGDALEQPLTVGEPCPVAAVTTYDGQDMSLPLAADGCTFLLFASFSCAVCRPVMERLAEVPEAVRSRFVLMMLDSDIRKYYSRELTELNLEAIQIVEAYAMATDFKISRAPYLYAIDPDGSIQRGSPVFSFDEFARIVAQVDRLYGIREVAS